ncbi:hypothetical protein [Rhizobium sp. G21]|uniref:hypothetical protein n=1 Tax=Rhizobium sp. G21 TaxID=2758439 RepID=UPI001600DA6A|nr:hypothetical protein [Rhizobium sp. G21]MBB1248335.1 hypothetical protein [Rhizobium sp. G21]
MAPPVVLVVSVIATLYDPRRQRRDRPMSEDFEFQKRLIHQFSAVLDGMKTLNSNISENIRRHRALRVGIHQIVAPEHASAR